MDIILCDKNPDLVSAWHHFFDRSGNAIVKQGDIFDIELSAIVLPINSFGIMRDGVGVPDFVPGHGGRVRIKPVEYTRTHPKTFTAANSP